MAKYAATPILNLKKTFRGEREWAQNEQDNWDRIDQFAQIVLANPPVAGTPKPIFNNTYQNFTIEGILCPAYQSFTYGSKNEILESVETYIDIPQRLVQYVYYPDTGLLQTSIATFNNIKITTTYLYDSQGNLTSMSSVEEVIE